MVEYKRVLVTGGSAVAGDGLRSAVEKGEYPGREFIFPRSKELNLLDEEATKKFIADWKPDAIVHFAAISGGIQLTLEHPASVMRDNIVMNFNVVEAAREAGVKKVLMTLSASCYPLETPIPMKEEYLHKGYPHETNYSYAFAKRLMDPMAKAYGKEYGLGMTSIIPGAIIGPRSNFNPNESTAVPGMIRRFYDNRDGSDPLVVWGDGTPVRQFTSDEDMGRIAMWCIDNCEETGPFNVSTSEETSIKGVAHMIAEAMGVDTSRLQLDTSKPNGAPSQSVDNSKFVKLSGFKYAPTRETIDRTVKYFVENYPNEEKLRL